MGREEKGELGLSLLPVVVAVPQPPERLICEGEGLCPEQKAFKRGGKVGRGDTAKSHLGSLIVLDVIWAGH